MRRTIGAILIETRPERISRSAWRGEARKASKPKRAMSSARADDRHHLDRAAGEAEGGGEERVAARPVAAPSSVVVITRSSTYCSSSSPSRSPRSMSRARSWRMRKLGPARRPRSPIFCGLSPIRARLGARRRRSATISSAMKTTVSIEREGAERPQLHRDRVEEDDLDVEEDEQHRDQVEADPEAEALLAPRTACRTRTGRPGRSCAALALRAEEALSDREERADAAAEDEEDDSREVGPEHRPGCTTLVTLCYLVADALATIP